MENDFIKGNTKIKTIHLKDMKSPTASAVGDFHTFLINISETLLRNRIIP